MLSLANTFRKIGGVGYSNKQFIRNISGSKINGTNKTTNVKLIGYNYDYKLRSYVKSTKRFIEDNSDVIHKFYMKFTKDVHYFQLCAENGNLSIMKELHRTIGYNPRNINNYALRHAAENGYLEVVEYLVEELEMNGDDISSLNYYAFRHAVTNGHIDVVKYLINKFDLKLDDYMENEYILNILIENKDHEMISYLKSIGSFSLSCVGLNKEYIRYNLEGEYYEYLKEDYYKYLKEDFGLTR